MSDKNFFMQVHKTKYSLLQVRLFPSKFFGVGLGKSALVASCQQWILWLGCSVAYEWHVGRSQRGRTSTLHSSQAEFRASVSFYFCYNTYACIHIARLGRFMLYPFKEKVTNSLKMFYDWIFPSNFCKKSFQKLVKVLETRDVIFRF
jgi:hypothetical protein